MGVGLTKPVCKRPLPAVHPTPEMLQSQPALRSFAAGAILGHVWIDGL